MEEEKEDIQVDFEAFKEHMKLQEKKKDVCPHCGRCPHCDRSRPIEPFPAIPYCSPYPWQTAPPRRWYSGTTTVMTC